MEGFGKSLGGMGTFGKVAAVGMATLAAAGAGVAVGIASAVSEAADFQQGIADVGALVNATTPQIQQLSDAALQLGQDTTLSGIGATDAAKAMKELAAAGFSVDEITRGATRGVLLLASATGTDVARAAEIAGDTFNTFRKALGLTAEDMPKIADLFTGVANVSSIGLEDIGNAMKTIGPVAAAMGIDLEDVTAAIAALGNQGIKGSEAGTALRGVLASLADPSKESAKLIKSLGLNFRDAQGEIKDFGGIADELRDKLGGLTQAQREQAIVQLFGRENLAAILALMSEGSEGLDEYARAIKEQGDAAAIGAKRNNTLRGAFESLKGSAETALIAFGTGLLPALQEFTQGITKAVNAAIPFITMLGQRMGRALVAVGGLFRRFGGYVGSAITAVTDAFVKLQRGQITINQFIGGVRTLLGTVFRDMGRVLRRVGDVIGPFVAQVAKQVKDALPEIASELVKVGRAFGTWVTGTAIPWVAARLPGWLSEITSWLTSTAIPAVVRAASALAGAIGGWLTTTAIPFLRTNLPLWGAALWGWLTQTALPAVANAALQLAGAMGGWLTTTAIPYLQTNLPLWGTALWGWLTGTALPAVAGAAGQLAGAIGGWLTGTAIPFLRTNLPVWGAALWGWLTQTAVPAVVGAAGQLAGAMGNWLTTTAIPFLQTNLPLWGAALWGWISGTAVPAVVGAIGQVAGAMGNWLTTTAIPYLQTNLPKWGAALWGWITSTAVPATAAAVQGLGIALSDWITTTAVPAAQGKIVQWGDAIVDYLEHDGLAKITFAGSVISTGLLKALLWDIKNAPENVRTIMEKVKEGLTSPLAEANARILVSMGELHNTIVTQLQRIGLVAGNEAAKIGIAIHNKILEGLGDLYGAMFSKGTNAIQGFINGITSMVGAVVEKSKEIAAAAAGAITRFLQERSPSKLTRGYGQFFVEGFVLGMDDKQQEAAKKAAEVASSIAKAVTDVLGASRLLSRFNFATDAPTDAQLGWFGHLAASLVATMSDVAAHFQKEALEQTDKFSDTLGKVGGSVKNAVEGLALLGKTDWAEASPTGSALGWFTHLSSSLVASFADAALTFRDGALEEAGKLGDAASKVGGSVKNALEGLAALASAKWADISPTGSAMSWFTFLVASLTQNFATAARGFAEEALPAASAFADTSGKVVGVIGPAIEGFAKLVDFRTPDAGRLDALMAAIKQIVAKFDAMAREMATDGIKATGDLADAAAKALGAAKTGVELFAAMAGDKDKAGNHQPIGVPSKEAIDQLVIAIKYVVAQFSYMAQDLAGDGVKQMQEFAGAAGQVLSAAKTGTDLFAAFDKLAIPARESIDALLGGMGYVIQQTRTIATGIGEEGLKQAQGFATGVLNFVTTTKSALQLFTELEEYKGIPAKILGELHAQMIDVLDWGHKLWEQGEAFKVEMQSFANSMREAARALAEGLSLGAGLPQGSPLLAPATLGAGGGTNLGRDSIPAGNTYTLNMYGDNYDTSNFEDRIVATMESAARKGRA